jgi:hypothetical protein
MKALKVMNIIKMKRKRREMSKKIYLMKMLKKKKKRLILLVWFHIGLVANSSTLMLLFILHYLRLRKSKDRSLRKSSFTSRDL